MKNKMYADQGSCCKPFSSGNLQDSFLPISFLTLRAIVWKEINNMQFQRSERCI